VTDVKSALLNASIMLQGDQACMFNMVAAYQPRAAGQILIHHSRSGSSACRSLVNSTEKTPHDFQPMCGMETLFQDCR
jgi:hypothetical protein